MPQIVTETQKFVILRSNKTWKVVHSLQDAWKTYYKLSFAFKTNQNSIKPVRIVESSNHFEKKIVYTLHCQ